ncbi:hypothetical protein [Microvirga subterranea]|uniref:Uncharacterized protein n=1 Tax=Microvirga subterranea TaxID=186651 RepID=A0A370HNJ5_9HYPH|nr:hypothetical protein [Microvirga subterranea]RDI59910.1 hypothetical protein DES45_103166 [Microvirga subterranea]
MTTRTTLGTAQQLHLNRAARTAGEAFAFEEPDTAPVAPASRSYGTNFLWVVMAVIAVLALWLSF